MQVDAPALKGIFHMLLLSILVDSPLHGYAVIDALKQGSCGQFQISEKSVYPALHRLEHQGFVGSSTSLVNGRTLRTYSITPEGRRHLKAEWRAWEEFSAVVAKLVARKPGIP
jgi:PadR family transcriptional regulator PadR